MLVGSVSVFIGKAETNQHARHFKCVIHLSDKWDRAAFTDEYGFFLKALFEGRLRALKNGRVVRRGPRFAAAEDFELAVHRFRQEFANVFFDKFRDALRILAWDQPRGKFGVGL